MKDITNIHPEEEVFLLGNLYALKGLATHLFRGLIGLVTGLCTLGGAWVGSQKVREMTTDLTKIPADLLKSLPGIGNLFAAHCNKTAFNELITKEKAQAKEPAENAQAKEPAEKARRKDQFDTAKEQLEANLFYKNFKLKIPIFLSSDTPFPELRRLAFLNKDAVTANSDLEKNIKKLVVKIPQEKLLIFLTTERGDLEKTTPAALWKVSKEVFIEKVEDKLKLATDDQTTEILDAYFSVCSLEELTRLSKLVDVDVQTPRFALALSLSEKENAPKIAPEIWQKAIKAELHMSYPNPQKYLSALPRGYLEELVKNGGTDVLYDASFKQEDITAALQSSMGGMGRLTNADWGRNLSATE